MNLHPSSASRDRYPNDRVTDNTAEFAARLRANSPRQRRLREEYNALLASRRQIVEDILGALALITIIIILAIL